ncbi:class II aldolase/adducin family protein [Patulibacter americanus]|uniref:class II aldolase/adducin family protein n=1 Tax=Patulibacter americanus TaxID=588672 RepID=UPI0004250395|nr:class II aldolase/adducin family protein [Patulibacter americanus]
MGEHVARGLRRRVVAVARTLEADGLVVGTVGNVSARDGGALLITPTRAPYARMRPRDLARVDVVSGEPLPGGLPSRELPLHLAVYRARPDVGALVHTHSLAATAWSFLDEPLGPELEDLAYHGIDPVRTAPPAAPGSAELAEGAVAALGSGSAVLLGRHGVLAAGDTPERALLVARVLERQAQIGWLLRGAAPWAASASEMALPATTGWASAP